MDPNAESDVRRLVGLSKLGEALRVGLAAAAAEGDDAAREAALKMLVQVLTGACVRVGPARRLQPGRVFAVTDLTAGLVHTQKGS